MNAKRLVEPVGPDELSDVLAAMHCSADSGDPDGFALKPAELAAVLREIEILRDIVAEEKRRFEEHLDAWRVNSRTSLERIEDLQRQLASRTAGVALLDRPESER
jgi:hypothetical protein